MAMPMTALAPGFATPVRDSQRTFRLLLEAMAHPGRVVELPEIVAPPPPLGPASAAALLTLADVDTPVWLAGAEATAPYLRFHCGCPIAADSASATFAFVARPSDLPPLERFGAGQDASPELSATVLIEVGGLVAGRGRRLAGPGIADETRLEVAGLPERFWDGWRRNRALFPRGVDIIFTAGALLAALPRTTIDRG